jgi:hypothetical protein
VVSYFRALADQRANSQSSRHLLSVYINQQVAAMQPNPAFERDCNLPPK